MTGAVNTAGKSQCGTVFEHTYPGEPTQVSQVRRDLRRLTDGWPVADDLILLASELCTNAVLHSRSGQPGGSFTILTEIHPEDFAWIEVADQGGAWHACKRDGSRPHGLDIVGSIAGDDNWGIDGDPRSHVVWVRLDWPTE